MEGVGLGLAQVAHQWEVVLSIRLWLSSSVAGAVGKSVFNRKNQTQTSFWGFSSAEHCVGKAIDGCQIQAV